MHPKCVPILNLQSLLITDTFEPQVSPLTATELELWHWVLLQTRGVGFYNSNLMAGASQAHKHMQFVPGDAIWSLRNPDAMHVRGLLTFLIQFRARMYYRLVMFDCVHCCRHFLSTT
jgi:hypothetical protein